MRRRDFIHFLGGVVTCLPLTAHGQQPSNQPTIAFLGVDDSSWRLRTSAFVQRLNELGWVAGRTVLIQYYWTLGRPERTVELAAEIRRPPVVAVPGGRSAGVSVRRAAGFGGAHPAAARRRRRALPAARRDDRRCRRRGL